MVFRESMVSIMHRNEGSSCILHPLHGGESASCIQYFQWRKTFLHYSCHGNAPKRRESAPPRLTFLESTPPRFNKKNAHFKKVRDLKAAELKFLELRQTSAAQELDEDFAAFAAKLAAEQEAAEQELRVQELQGATYLELRQTSAAQELDEGFAAFAAQLAEEQEAAEQELRVQELQEATYKAEIKCYGLTYQQAVSKWDQEVDEVDWLGKLDLEDDDDPLFDVWWTQCGCDWDRLRLLLDPVSYFQCGVCGDGGLIYNWTYYHWTHPLCVVWCVQR
jgi:hypothetical protein